MSEYYTPKISELHVGFDYYEEDGRYILKPKTINSTGVLARVAVDIKTFEGEEEQPIRVKYLDQQDIEDLGFEYTPHTDGLRGIGNGGDLILQQCTNLNSHNGIGTWISTKSDATLFFGVIKNKSELKRVLEMIGYEL